MNISNQNLEEPPNDLPNSLTSLFCDYNQLTSLPDNLPDSLKELICSNNKLTKLPDNLPETLRGLWCSNNELTSLPENLPRSLHYLSISNNPNLTNISGIWNCKNLKGMYFTQEHLKEEIELYCKINSCAMIFY